MRFHRDCWLLRVYNGLRALPRGRAVRTDPVIKEARIVCHYTMTTLGVPVEAVGLPAVADNKGGGDLRGRVRMAEEWRAARDRQAAADEKASRRAELDALAAALVAELRRAPLERLSEDGVVVLRPHHALYMDTSVSTCTQYRNTRVDLRNELNARLEAAAHGVRVTHIRVWPRRGLLHRVCQCGCDFGSIDECPSECCCCVLWSAACACLPIAYWLPRMCGDHTNLIAEWEVRVDVEAAMLVHACACA